MSDFYVGQKVRVTKTLYGYREGQLLTVKHIDEDGDPSFEGEYFKIGWGSAESWTTPITTPEPEIELTQVRILGRLYNLVPETA